MATVYLARDLRHDREVAIKVLRPELAAVIGADRFLAEIKTTANLQHPHILSLFDSGGVDGTVFYVMPFVDGESLRDRLDREKQLPVNDALRIAREVADALGYAHAHGVIHRDIKPENILLQGGHALVADFGIALAASKTGAERMTQTGMSLGTPHYMSPEQAMGERELDVRTDIYALGCVLYEMLIGEPPFTGPTAQAIIAKLITEGASSVRAKRPTVPEHVDDAVATALQKLPADRFSSAQEFASALDVTVTTPRRAPVPHAKKISFARLEVIAGGIALIALAGFMIGRATAHSANTVTLGHDQHVTWDPALEVTPALSPDGRSVAYASGQITAMRIMVRPVGEGRAQALSGDPNAQESQPEWSPDGSRILYLSNGGVFSAPSGGGPARPEIPGVRINPVLSATWSPDGKRIGFTRGDSLFVREFDGTATRLIAHLDQPTLCKWSPRGTFVACVTGNVLYATASAFFGNRSPSRIAVVRISDGGTAMITDTTSLNTSPAWSSDERQLFFVSDRDGQRDIYSIGLDTKGNASGSVARLSAGLGAHTIALSPNGTRIAYSRYSNRASIWSLPMPPTDRFIMTTHATRVTDANEIIEAFNVSPDGKWLVYDSDLAGTSDVFRLALSGGEPERLTTDPADDFSPAISPDGKEVAFHSWRSGNRDLYVQRLDGGGVTRVTNTPAQESNPDWSPDGNALAYVDLQSTRAIGIVRRDASGRWGDRKIVSPVAGGKGAWSPDGRWIATVRGVAGGNLVLVPVDSGAERTLVDAGAPGNPRVISVYWGNGSLVYYEANDAKGNTSIYSIPVTGGAARELVRFDPALHPPNRGAFAVRNGTLFFAAESRESDIWVMEIKHP